jgi:hypothetical protein
MGGVPGSALNERLRPEAPGAFALLAHKEKESVSPTARDDVQLLHRGSTGCLDVIKSRVVNDITVLIDLNPTTADMR